MIGSAVESLLSSLHSPSALSFVFIQSVASVVFVYAVCKVVKESGSISISGILLIGILSRLLLIHSMPLFDDDIHRYLWDGKVMASGINPFLYAPSDEKLAGLRDSDWHNIGYPDIKTIYPPGSQIFFASAHAVGIRSITGLKSLFFLFDVGNMFLIIGILGALGLRKEWVIVYAWSPLAVKEFANSGHVEPLMLFFLLLALHGMIRSDWRGRWASISFGFAVAVKFVPILAVPILFRLGKWRAPVYALMVVAALYLPFIHAGTDLFSGAGMYARHWEFNGSIFPLLSSAERFFSLSKLGGVSSARLLCSILMGSDAIRSSMGVNPGERVSAFRAIRNTIAAVLLLMPTVDPWYVCWLLPFLCIAPSPGLLALTVTCNLSYLYYAHNTYPIWVPLLEYLPVYGLLLWERVGRKGNDVMTQRHFGGESI